MSATPNLLLKRIGLFPCFAISLLLIYSDYFFLDLFMPCWNFAAIMPVGIATRAMPKMAIRAAAKRPQPVIG